jgi:uncharacterized protein YegP (UPF0339 family)
VEFQIVRTTDPRAPFFWRMVDDVGHLLTYSSDRYASVDACRAAIEEIKRTALDATITVLD